MVVKKLASTNINILRAQNNFIHILLTYNTSSYKSVLDRYTAYNLCHNLVILTVNNTILETNNLDSEKKIIYISGLTRPILIL